MTFFSQIRFQVAERMNKLEIIVTLRDECQIQKKEAVAIVDVFFDTISTALAKGDRV